MTRGPIPPAELIQAALAEDLGDGDRTVAWTVPSEALGKAAVLSRADGVLFGLELAAATFGSVDPGLRVEPLVSDGATVAPGDVLLRVEGRLASILAAERTALNFLGRLSGIASAARRYVEAIDGTGCRIADTRKTTPGWRALEKSAAAAGGAMNHRSGLYDMVLIKENHIRAAGGVLEALDAALVRAREEGLEVEIEVTTLDELKEALTSQPDRVLLDNMSIEDLRTAVTLVRANRTVHPMIEASGGITLATVRDVASTGVDYISVGAITHSAPALDLSLQVTDT